MKRVLLSISAVLAFCGLHAQIQLSQPSIPFPKAHVVVGMHTAGTAGVMAPIVGTNQVWDYSTLTGGVDSSRSFIPNTNSSFAKSAIVDTGSRQSLTSSVSIITNRVYGEDQNGIYWYGNYTNKQTVYLNKTKTDSIFIPDQPNPFSKPQSLVSLPAAYKSFWDNNFTDSLFFTLSVKIASIKNVPCYGKLYLNTRDSIAGWGTLYLPSPNKKSIGYPVLLIKRKTITVDTIFVNGAPADNNLLKLAGAGNQGQVTTDYSEYFYAENRFMPLLAIDYGPDSKYTTPSYFAYSKDSVKSGINIYKSNISEFSVYPNPSSNTSVNCSFNKSVSAPWSLSIVNALGQVVSNQSIKGSGNINAQIAPETFKSTGIYFLNILDENGGIAASSRVCINK